MPTCGKCGYNVFITVPAPLVGPDAKLVCCGQCHAVVGVVDSEGINAKLEKALAALKMIATKLGISLPLYFMVYCFGSDEFLPECPFVLAPIEFEGANNQLFTHLV